ncbi:MAG TPA: DUF3267 domain-containing protein [Sporosarcina sp.]|nr:DUF3267 domain-containing protein [Sporosarcina sp.]
MQDTRNYKVISLHLETILKQSLYITLGSLVMLFGLKWLFHSLPTFSFSLRSLLLSVLIISIGYILLIVLHEFFHLLGFHLFGKVPWKSMKVGADLKQGIAYATTTTHMPNHAVKKALLLPFWMTGVFPAIIGIVLGHNSLLIISALLIGGAAGDFSMYHQLKKYPNHWMIQDDPTLPKMYIYNPDEKAQ